MRLSGRLMLLAVALTAAISLYPFQGWQWVAVAWRDFFLAPLPRVITLVDLAGNVTAYVPLGALLMLSLRTRLATGPAVLASWLLATLLSLAMECLQHFLPSRVPSNLDVLANSLGAAIGVACALRWGYLVAHGGWLERTWQRLREEGRAQEAGLALLAVWWLAQWSPRTPIFGIGGMRQMLDMDAPGNFSVDRFIFFEALSVGAGLLAAGLVTASLLRRRRRQAALAVLGIGMLIKTVGVDLLVVGSDALAWLTPGASRGMVVGGVLLLACAGLHAGLRRAVAACSLLLAVALNNLIPDNPYLLPGVPAFPEAQWLNFDGLSRLAAVLWPFLTLSWLMSARRTS